MTRLLPLILLAGCIADLDMFMHNPRHCSVIGPDTCEDKEEVMDRLCSSCDEDYPFAERGMPADRVTALSFDSDGVTNDAYFVAAPADSPLKNLTIMVSHGNYASIEHYLHTMEALYGVGANLFTYEYPGYGKSSAQSPPSETAFFANAEAALALLEGELSARGLPRNELLLYGMSLGALPSVHLAKAHDFRALILEAPYPSASLFLADSSATTMPASYVLSGNYDNLAKLPDVTEPILLIHSESDDFIRIEHSDKLFAEMNDPKCFWRHEVGEHGVSDGVAVNMGYGPYAEAIAGWLETGVCP